MSNKIPFSGDVWVGFEMVQWTSGLLITNNPQNHIITITNVVWKKNVFLSSGSAIRYSHGIFQLSKDQPCDKWFSTFKKSDPALAEVPPPKGQIIYFDEKTSNLDLNIISLIRCCHWQQQQLHERVIHPIGTQCFYPLLAFWKPFPQSRGRISMCLSTNGCILPFITLILDICSACGFSISQKWCNACVKYSHLCACIVTS